MHQPTLESLTSQLPGNLGDPTLTTWILSWEWHALTTDPTLLFEGNMFYPFGEAIKYSDSMLPLAPVFGVLAVLTGDPLLAHHVLVLLLSLLCLISTYLLARRLVDPITGVIAAVAFTFSGFVFMHQTHMPLLTLGIFPLGLLFLFRLLDERRLRDGVIFGLVSVALVASSLYYAAIWVPSVALIVAWDLVRSWPPSRSWMSSVATAGAVLIGGVGPIAYVYAEFQARVPWQRDMGANVIAFSDLITPAPQSLLYEPLFNWANGRTTTGLAEHGFFIGFVTLAFGVVGLIALLAKRIRERQSTSSTSVSELVRLTVVGAMSLGLAFGPTLGPFPLPFRFLQDHVIGYDNIRAVSRLAVPFLLSVAVLAAWGLRVLLARVGRGVQGAVIVIAALILLAELFVEPIYADVPAAAPIRPLLASQQPGAVVELPIRETPDTEYVYIEGPRLVASIGDWRPRWNGFSGGYPPGYVESLPTIMQFPQPGAIAFLEANGIRYVVLHGAAEPTGSEYSFDQIRQMLRGLPDQATAIRAGDAWLVDLGS
jgi:hypothetical protein